MGDGYGAGDGQWGITYALGGGSGIEAGPIVAVLNTGPGGGE